MGAENLILTLTTLLTLLPKTVPVLLQREVQDLCPIDTILDGIIGKSRSYERKVQRIVQLKYVLEGRLVSTADILKRQKTEAVGAGT